MMSMTVEELDGWGWKKLVTDGWNAASVETRERLVFLAGLPVSTPGLVWHCFLGGV